NQSIEEIINSWSSALEKDASNFASEAKRVAAWDSVLRDSTRSISELTDNVSRLLLQQNEVDRTLGNVSSYQEELCHSLGNLEAEVDGMFAGQGGEQPQDADIQREQAYQRVIDVSVRLRGIQSSVDGVVGDLNAAQEKTNGEGSLGQIVAILNAHYETLNRLEASTRDIEDGLRE
ncbi:hypothetical protein TrRE_jg12998, partial [Triparma retinervis]